MQAPATMPGMRTGTDQSCLHALQKPQWRRDEEAWSSEVGPAGPWSAPRPPPVTSQGRSTPEELLHLLCTCINKGRSEALIHQAPQVLDANCTVIDPNFGKYVGIEQCMEYYGTIWKALANVQLSLARMEAISSTSVRACWTMTARHSNGPLFGISPKGTAIEVQGIALHSFTPDRKIRLSEYNWNAIAVMKQLMGVAPGSPAGSLSLPAEDTQGDPHFAGQQLPRYYSTQQSQSTEAPESDSDVNSSENGTPDTASPLQQPSDPPMGRTSPEMCSLSTGHPLDGIIGESEPNDFLQLVSDDFHMGGLELQQDDVQGLNLDGCHSQQTGHCPTDAAVVKAEPGMVAEEEPRGAPGPAAAPYGHDEKLGVRRGFFGQEGPVHGTQVCLQFLEYQCGYCGDRKISTSAGSDGRVRIRCECGGKHADGKPRMHAKWKLCTDVPLPEDVASKGMQTVMVGGRPFNCPKRPALSAACPY